MNSGLLRFSAFLFLCACTAVCAAAAPSQVIATNFGPDESYGTPGVAGTPIQNFPGGIYLDHALRFSTTGSDYWLDSAHLPLYRQADQPFTITLHIANDAGGVPGTDIATRFYDGFFPIISDINTLPPTAISWPSHQVLLHPGTPYWLYITGSPNQPQDLYWHLNNTGKVGNYAFRSNSGAPLPNQWNPSNTFPTPAFSLLGTAVPEPAAATLAIVSAALFGSCRRSRR